MPVSHADTIATKVTALKVPFMDEYGRRRTSQVVQCAGCGVWLEGNFLFCNDCSKLKMQDKPLPAEARVSELVGYIMDALERS